MMKTSVCDTVLCVLMNVKAFSSHLVNLSFRELPLPHSMSLFSFHKREILNISAASSPAPGDSRADVNCRLEQAGKNPQPPGAEQSRAGRVAANKKYLGHFSPLDVAGAGRGGVLTVLSTWAATAQTK